VNRRKFLIRAVGCAAGVSLSGIGYSAYEAGWLRVTRRKVIVPRLPAPFIGKTLALLTDPHHGPFTSRAFLREAVDATLALKPDLIALGGDYVQGAQGSRYIAGCFEELGRLVAPLGVYAVPGNHDHWDGIQAVRRAIAAHPIADVTNSGCWIECDGSRLRVCGVDDLWEGHQDLDAALGDATADDACLLLSHNPDFAEALTDRRVSLVLSGHMHGGQVVLPVLGPRLLPSKYGRKYLEGLVRAPHVQVYVSRGLGTVRLPFRFRSRPEVNLLTLTAAQA
jgi:uncharacterized protein